MGISIRYEARRETPLNGAEEKKILEIITTYCDAYPFGKKFEDFLVFDKLVHSDTVFYGATKLPMIVVEDYSTWVQITTYWLACLTEITHVLKDAIWSAGIESISLVWDEVAGWRFPAGDEVEES